MYIYIPIHIQYINNGISLIVHIHWGCIVYWDVYLIYTLPMGPITSPNKQILIFDLNGTSPLIFQNISV